jgi:ATP-dependent Clp protease adapter protein ClpS
MFSSALEVVLTVAERKATVRRHTHLTLEHLLYALAGDADGEQILSASGVDALQLRRDLDRYLEYSIGRLPSGQQKAPEWTSALRRVLETAAQHVESAGRQEVQTGDVIATTLQQDRAYAAQLLSARGSTRLEAHEAHERTELPPAPIGGSDVGDGAKVLLLNDDHTPMEFVVQILENVFHKKRAEAYRIMIAAHMQGQGLCGVYSREVAETKLNTVIRMARENGFPLRATMEPE